MNCRRVPAGQSDGTVKVHRADAGTAYFTGLQTCGHISCPVCGRKIRDAERARLSSVVRGHLDGGGAVYLFLLSLSHGPLDKLGDLLDGLDAGRSAAIGGKGGSRWAKDRRDYAVAGTAWYREDVHGRNGWHPHVHGLLFTDRELTDDDLDQLGARIYGRHRDAVAQLGYKTRAVANGLQRVRDPEALPDYATKSDTRPEAVAAEMTRGDLKSAKGRTPNAILRRFVETGDADDLDRFLDYERACEGRRWRYLSPVLAKLHADVETAAEDDVDAAEVEDRQDAAEDMNGAIVLRIPLAAWRVLVGRRGAVAILRGMVRADDLDRARWFVEEAGREADRRFQRDRPPRSSLRQK